MNTSMCEIVDPFRSKDWTKQFCAGEFDQFNNQTNYCMGKMTIWFYFNLRKLSSMYILFIGDIGSALYMPHVVNDQFKYVAVGILSYNEGCATQHTPG